MVNPSTGVDLSTLVNTTPPSVSTSTIQKIVVFMVAGLFLMILVQWYPKVIIGLVLLILVSVFLYDYQTILNLFNKVGLTGTTTINNGGSHIKLQ